jgi:hypothetical protein
LVVWIDIEIVSFMNDKPSGVEGFGGVRDLDGGGRADSVGAATCEEPSRHKFIYPFFCWAKRMRGNKCDWMNGRVSLVVVAAVSRLGEAAVHKPN